MPFTFKHFHINDDQCAMKVGTDGVLLGAWVNVIPANNILDVGTGSGLIAMMMAQRSAPTVKIDAIEVQEHAATQAAENIAASPWPEKIRVVHTALQNFKPAKKFDLIVSNPPYFNDLVPPGNRKAARHSASLTPTELISFSKENLLPDGRLAVVLPTAEGNEFHRLANMHGFFCKRRTAVFAKESKPQERWLFEFIQKILPCLESSLVLTKEGKRSEEYQALTSDFYL